jgi:deoxyribodipyrimidine photo-lyase
MYTKRGVMWFRQDLRLHDNEALTEALRSTDEVIPVYVFDDRFFKGETTNFGFPKTGKFRTQFIIESVMDLRDSLRRLGSDLIVRIGKPEEEVFEVARKAKSNWVFCNRERTPDEVYVQDALEQRLWSVGQEIRYSRGKMLYYTADLPFPITHTPDTFAQFKKEVERYVPVRDPLPAPEKMASITVRLEPGDVPTATDFGHEDVEQDERAVINHKGGESEGRQRLQEYIWQTDRLQHYCEERDQLIGEGYSTKFSAWLSQGCLSPKLVYQHLKAYEEQHRIKKSFQGVFYALMWRDFHRFMAKKHHDLVFQKGGITDNADPRWRNDENLLQKWIEGKTGVPFIDANMRELKLTGYISNRGRQNVASFLVHDLQVNWQMGAEYFESILIDYDPASNWGNWNSLAGVGSDPREEKHLTVSSQSMRYDPQGEYIRRWVPELQDLPTEKLHQPDQLTSSDKAVLNGDYAAAMVDAKKWRR